MHFLLYQKGFHVWYSALCLCLSGTRCLYKRARDYARRPLATWLIMWYTLHPACLSSPPITSQHRPHRPTASAWTPPRKSLLCLTLDKITNVLLSLIVPSVLSFISLYCWCTVPHFFKAVSLWGKNINLWLGCSLVDFTVNSMPHL